VVPALLLAACGGGSAPSQQGSNTDPGLFVPGGSILEKPDGSGLFRLDDNYAGQAEEFRIVEMVYGRLVTVLDYDDSDPLLPVETVQYRDYVIGQGVTSDGINYRVESNPVTQETTLTILAKNDPTDSNDSFDQLLEQAANRTNVIFNRAPTDIPPFPLLARNSAILLRFSDALDHASINSNTVRVLVGNPPIAPYEARIIPDPNHGGLVTVGGKKEFRSTRIIVDLTISSLEAEALEPPLTPNTLGLPASAVNNQANVVLKIPGRIDFASGQFRRLENVARHGISVSNAFNGPIDAGSPTMDVIRAMRSGSVDDENNGFLVDLSPPQVVGEQTLRVVASVPDPAVGVNNRTDFIVSLSYDSVPCALRPRQDDIIRTPGGFFSVSATGIQPTAGSVSGVRVRSLQDGGNTATSLIGPGAILTTFDPLEGDPPECFVTFVPVPESPPTNGVNPTANLRVRFSEPMDPSSITAFDTFMVTAKANDALPSEVVVGRVLESADLQTFTFSPVLPYPHQEGISEQYTFSMDQGNTSAVDLAGNPLGSVLPQVAFKVSAFATPTQTASHVLRFHRQDEDGVTVEIPLGPTFSTPEIRGQFLYDLDRGVIRPRSVSRFQSLADRSQPVPSLMNNFPAGVQTPLSPLGSRLMTVWRYVDFNYALRDESLYNIDVEGIAWAPKNGQVVSDIYEEFQISLAHSNRMPDERLGDASNLPDYPDSGLMKGEWDTASLLGNLLDDPLNKPMKVVYEKQGGYVVTPADLFTADTGTKFLPFPLNEDINTSDFVFYTWRDTSIRARGAPEGAGADPAILFTAQLISSGDVGNPYGAGSVPSIGLPLLMDFRCYPSDSGVGLNAFDVSLAVNSSGQPNFRLFATGGINVNQDEVIKDPDTEPRPTGGFNPSNGGKGTKGFDNVFYHGALDIVVRISRVVTTWIDSGSTGNWMDPVLEPSVDEQPGGTEIIMDFRGAKTLGEELANAAKIAADYDAYGNARPSGHFGRINPVEFFPLKLDSSWVDDIDLIDGARYAQVRLTFIGNAVSTVIPELSAIGIAFERL